MKTDYKTWRYLHKKLKNIIYPDNVKISYNNKAEQVHYNNKNYKVCIDYSVRYIGNIIKYVSDIKTNKLCYVIYYSSNGVYCCHIHNTNNTKEGMKKSYARPTTLY